MSVILKVDNGEDVVCVSIREAHDIASMLVRQYKKSGAFRVYANYRRDGRVTVWHMVHSIYVGWNPSAIADIDGNVILERDYSFPANVCKFRRAGFGQICQ